MQRVPLLNPHLAMSVRSSPLTVCWDPGHTNRCWVKTSVTPCWVSNWKSHCPQLSAWGSPVILPNLPRVSSTVHLNWLPLCADWWAPCSFTDREEDLWSMRCSFCTMVLSQTKDWSIGLCPCRPWPMSISCAFTELKLGFGIHPEDSSLAESITSKILLCF